MAPGTAFQPGPALGPLGRAQPVPLGALALPVWTCFYRNSLFSTTPFIPTERTYSSPATLTNSHINHLQFRRARFDPWVGKIPWRRKWQPTPVLLPRKFHGWRSLVGYSPWGHEESDMTERLHNFTILPRGGYGHPLQYSCLGRPMDRGAWCATIHRITKRWTWLKQLSMHTHNQSILRADLIPIHH